MSLTALTHRKLATTTSSGTAINNVLDAIWAAVDQSTVITYADGSSRAFSGTGATGWTWSRIQPTAGTTEAIWAKPPGGTMDQRVIIAGRSAAPTPAATMLSPDTFPSSGLIIGHQLSAGAFTTWNSATPFTNARFTGYTRMGPSTATLTAPIQVSIIESQDTIEFELISASGASIYGCGAGGLCDPETSDAADAETDGIRYGVWTVGASVMATTMLANNSTGTVFNHSTSAGNNHFYLWRPGLNAVDTVRRMANYTFTPTVQEFTTNSGKYPGVPLYGGGSLSWGGRIREVHMIRPLLNGQVITSGGTIKGYAWSNNIATSNDTILFRY